MKLRCHKCQKLLTSDLRPVKVHTLNGYIFNKSALYDSWDEPYESYNEITEQWDQEGVRTEYGHLKKGIFYLTKNCHYNWSHKDNSIKGYFRTFKELPKIVVGHSSILDGIIPDFVSGYGCCNWSMGHTLTCNCGETLGEMHLDCYEDGSVRFDPKKVVRCYK